MTPAEDAAKDIRAVARRGRPFQILALIAASASVGLQLGIVAMLLTLLGGPLLVWLLVAGDRARLKRALPDGVLARASAALRTTPRGRRWIGLLSVETDSLHWKPGKRFRNRGATDVAIPWSGLRVMDAARVSAPWMNWMARNDLLIVEITDGTRFVFSITSPQVIYAALATTGHAAPVPP